MECANCGVESDSGLCAACLSILKCTYYRKRLWGENEGLVNRRWQMRFLRGELEDVESDAGVLWQTKRELQTW